MKELLQAIFGMLIVLPTTLFSLFFIMSFGQNQIVNVYADNQLVYTGPKYQVQTTNAGANTQIDIYKGRTQFNLQKTYFVKQVEIK